MAFQFDHRAVLANQAPDVLDTFNKNYEIGRQRGLENAAIEKAALAGKEKQAWAAGDKKKSLARHLIDTGFEDEGYTIAENETKLKKSEAEASKIDYENRLKMIEIGGKATQELLMRPDLSKQVVKEVADSYFNAGLTSPEMYQKQMSELPNMPDDPAQLRKRIEANAMALQDAKEQMKFQRPDANAMLNAQTQMRNQDLDYSLGQQNLGLDQEKADFSNQMDLARYNLDNDKQRFTQGMDLQKQQLEEKKRTDSLNPGVKMSESQKKQVIGVQNTRNAIAEYRDQLKNFGVLDLASPNARAAMGTKYNNMMLQAKEAYNLGVLNGPDLEILQSVITNPASLKGSVTSKKALDSQASELDRIMGQIQKVSSGNLSSGATSTWGEPSTWDDDKVNAFAKKHGATVEQARAYLKSQGRL